MKDCIKYGRGYKYQLRAPYVCKVEIEPPADIVTDWIVLERDGTLTIRAGYAWDGASGPTYDSKSSMRASLVHDAIYQLMRMRLLDRDYREEADLIFRRMCLEDGMWSMRASLWYQAVRTFAGAASDPANVEPDSTAGCGC